MNSNRRWKPMVAVLIGVGFGLGTGCKSDKPKIDILQLEGKVEQVKANPDGTGEITIIYFSETHDQEVLGTGEVTKETEITINGVVSPLSAIRVGDRVRGEVRVEKKGREKRQTAIKIYVERAKPVGAKGS